MCIVHTKVIQILEVVSVWFAHNTLFIVDIIRACIHATEMRPQKFIQTPYKMNVFICIISISFIINELQTNTLKFTCLCNISH